MLYQTGCSAVPLHGFSDLSHDMFIFTPDFWTKGLLREMFDDTKGDVCCGSAQCWALSWAAVAARPVAVFTPGIARGLLLGMAGWQRGLEEGDAELLPSCRIETEFVLCAWMVPPCQSHQDRSSFCSGVLSAFGKCQFWQQRVPSVALHVPVLLPKDFSMDRKELT